MASCGRSQQQTNDGRQAKRFTSSEGLFEGITVVDPKPRFGAARKALLILIEPNVQDFVLPTRH